MFIALLCVHFTNLQLINYVCSTGLYKWRHVLQTCLNMDEHKHTQNTVSRNLTLNWLVHDLYTTAWLSRDFLPICSIQYPHSLSNLDKSFWGVGTATCLTWLALDFLGWLFLFNVLGGVLLQWWFLLLLNYRLRDGLTTNCKTYKYSALIISYWLVYLHTLLNLKPTVSCLMHEF